MRGVWKQGLFTTFLMVVVGHGSAQAALEEWSNAGLYGGDAVIVKYNPGNGWLYTGNSKQGLLRRTVGQTTWQEAGGAAGAFMADLAIDPTDASTLYMAARVLGIFKSTDNATTFSLATTGLTGTPDIQNIVAAPSAPGTLYAGDRAGEVWKSTDSAASWSLTSLAPGSDIVAAWRIDNDRCILGNGGGEPQSELPAVAEPERMTSDQAPTLPESNPSAKIHVPGGATPSSTLPAWQKRPRRGAPRWSVAGQDADPTMKVLVTFSTRA